MDFSREAMEIGTGFLALIQNQRAISGLLEDLEAPTNTQVTRVSFALTGEVFELAQELGWKNWKQAPEMTPEQVEKVAEEFADVVAFFGLLAVITCARTGLDHMDLAKAYMEKSEKNRLRLSGASDEAGYNGVEND